MQKGATLATHNREIGIHLQSTASRNRAIAADSRATRIYLRATDTRSREIGIYSQEIATDSLEIASEWWSCASTSQEMAVNIEEIAGYARRNTAAAVRRLPAAGLAPVLGRTPLFSTSLRALSEIRFAREPSFPQMN